jgi:hypothetical protein
MRDNCAARPETQHMTEFHNRVIEAINAEIRRTATYPNALYLGKAEQQQLQEELAGDGGETKVDCENYFGLRVFLVKEPSHFAAVWNPSLAAKEASSEWTLDYIPVRAIRTRGQTEP